MSRVKEPTTENNPSFAADEIRQTLVGRRVCPYCGHQNAGGTEPCPGCTMEDTPATRQATKARIGPWYVLQSRNPAAPGMKYATLLALINKGHVAPRSIVRGPTTYQLWRFAAHVRGISREFGLCYSCGGAIDRATSICPHCQRTQDAPVEPDVLLEARANGHVPVDPAAPVVEASSYASRMHELNRQRAQGEDQARDSRDTRAQREPMSAPRPRNEITRRGDGRVVSAMELAAALQDDPGKALRGPRRLVLKTFLLLIVLAVAGGAGLLYFKPEYRQPTYAWVNNTWTTIKTKVSSIEWPTVTTEKTTVKPVPAPPVVIEEPAPAIQNPSPAPQIKPRVEDPVVSRVEPSAPPPSPLDPAQALQQARRLWGQAIDAEARQDFASAAGLYEQIKKLPRDTWPAGLQLRLDSASSRAGQTSAR